MTVLDHPRTDPPRRRARATGRPGAQAGSCPASGIVEVYALNVIETKLLKAYTTRARSRDLLMLTIGSALVVALVPRRGLRWVRPASQQRTSAG